MNLRSILKTSIISLPLAIMVGCGGGSSSSSSGDTVVKTITGVLIDSAVSGVDYRCSSGMIGVTNSAGEFICNVGDTVDFSLGDLPLGSVAVRSVITPGTLFPNNSAAALNLAQLLQTFDTDSTTDGISLENVDLTEFLTNIGGVENLDFRAANFDTLVGAALPAGITLVNEADAQSHLDDSFAELGINSDGTKKELTDTTAPNFTSSAIVSINENTRAVITVTTDDDTATLTLGGTDADAFTLTDGVLTLKIAADYETKTSYLVTVTARDAASNSKEQTISVNVIDIDETLPDTTAPNFISSASITMNENRVSVVEIITDDTNAILTLSGTDASLFKLVGSVLTFKVAPDYELDKHSYSLILTAKDTANNRSTQNVSITILDVDESIPDTIAPSFTSSGAVSINENQTAVTTVTTDDAAAVLSLGGTDAGAFNLASDGVLTLKVAADFETKPSYSVTVTATDTASNATDQTITVTVVNVVELPVIEALNTNISEHITAGTVVGYIIISSNGDSPITDISLSGTNNTDFTVDANGVVRVSAGVSLDFASKPTYTLTALAQNDTDSSASVDFNISIQEYLNYFQVEKRFSNTPKENNKFGSSVAIDGEYVVIGEYGAQSIHLYKKDANGELTLLNSITKSLRNFGVGVDIVGRDILVASYGKAVLYRIDDTNETLINEILTIDTTDLSMQNASYFGVHIKLSVDYIVVGNPQDDADGNTNNARKGSAFVFKRNSDDTVTFIEKIHNPNVENYAYFSQKMSISGHYLAVGTFSREVSGFNAAGCVALYKIADDNSTVTLLEEILNPEPAANEQFGIDVSLKDNLLFVGASEDDNRRGSVYMYDIVDDTNIEFIQKLSSPQSENYEYYGKYLAFDGERLAVVATATDRDENLTNIGAIYFYNVLDNNVTYINRSFSSAEKGLNSRYASYDIQGNMLVAGIMDDSSNATNSGVAYMFNAKAESKVYVYETIKTVSSVKEGDTYTQKLDVASPEGEVSVSISGVDNSLFIYAKGSVISTEDFDYEDPTDASGDNVYELSIDLSDTVGHTSSTSVQVGVEDSIYIPVSTYQSSDPHQADYFGSALASDGDYLVIGATYEDTGTYSGGSAYLFKKESNGTLSELALFYADDAASHDGFGGSVAISGDYIAVGSIGNDVDTKSNSGAVYLFKRVSDTNVTQIAKIAPADGGANDQFGNSVSIDGSYILIASQGNDEAATNAGAAYLYKIDSSDDSVSLVSKITASDASGSTYFGSSVSIDGDYFVIGARRANNSYVGAAYLYKKDVSDVITEVEKFVGDDVSSGDNFGATVFIQGKYILASENRTSVTTGHAYLFEIDFISDTVSQLDKMSPADGISTGGFGSSLSMSSDRIVIGSEASEHLHIYTFDATAGDPVVLLEYKASKNPKTYNKYANNSIIMGSDIIVSEEYGDSESQLNTGFIHLLQPDANQP